jgi:hypothetical protein
MRRISFTFGHVAIGKISEHSTSKTYAIGKIYISTVAIGAIAVGTVPIANGLTILQWHNYTRSYTNIFLLKIGLMPLFAKANVPIGCELNLSPFEVTF